jgi:DNA repair exonuclease SbcCD ATPase subunit
MKKILVVGVLILGGLWACKKTNLCSYASTLWAKGQRAVKGQVPRQFELDRIRNEVEKLDSYVRGMLGPIAEKQAAVNRLANEVKTAQANHGKMREHLLTLTQQVEAGNVDICCEGEKCTLAGAKAKLALDFALFKAADVSLKSREQLLAAQRQNIALAHKRLSKIAEQKRNFELRLAQLEATEEHLNLEQVTAPLAMDQGPVPDIESTLNAIQHSQESEMIRRKLEEQYSSRPNTPLQPSLPTVNTQEIRGFLGVPTGTQPKVASSK